jgi:hypothetical protein
MPPTHLTGATSPRNGWPPATTDAKITGGYWYHQQRREPHAAVYDPRFQHELPNKLLGFTDVGPD